MGKKVRKRVAAKAWLRIITTTALAIVASAGLLMSTTPLSEAHTVLAGNLRLFGINIPWLETVAANRFVFWGSVLLALVIFVRWLLKREKPERSEEPTMPMHEAARHVARDSKWAERYPPEHDREWMKRIEREIWSALVKGSLRSWGVFAPHHQMGHTGPSMIEPSFWPNAGWEAHKLAFADPIIGSCYGKDGDYTDIMLYPSEVHAVWPRRSWKARLLKRSPRERLDRIAKRTGSQTYARLWRAQDREYARFHKDW